MSLKQDLRLEKVQTRYNKTSYKGLTTEQKKYIKAYELYQQTDKELADFYKYAKRNNNGGIDFDNMDESDLDLFELLNKKHDKAFKTMSILEDNGLNADEVLSLHKTYNTYSVSF